MVGIGRGHPLSRSGRVSRGPNRTDVGTNPVVVLLQNAPSRDVLEDWVDSEARVRGVFAPVFSSDRQLLGFRLQTPSAEHVDILQPRLGDTFASSPRLIQVCWNINPQGFPRHRVKVEGRVTYQDMGGGLAMWPMNPADTN